MTDANSCERDATTTVSASAPADITPPTVSSTTPSSSGPSANTTETFTVLFSETVSGVDISDFVLTSTGTAGGTIASVTGSGSTYSVVVNSITGDGTLRLDLKSSGTGIQDSASNPIAGGYTSGSSRTVGQPAPPVTPAPVPTLSEWAMILLGMVLAGGAALYIQRRRFTA
ncbi:IPTL-CTERM sorting domain-containing protein [Brevundimonas sp. NIBR11]|uniref:IPTL-CTERM sorting domain-containing protein n=1 Tax=Brevundimonas sp. NIBR11 TaxID=3015999 RepID=UPI0022F07634|nr:IPTL-CTERM sorting domain-containing protein [Brevundimonas sp. NIBR11]